MNSCVICNTETSFLCSRCKNAFYCGKQCQRDDWVNHTLVCKDAKIKTTTATNPQPRFQKESIGDILDEVIDDLDNYKPMDISKYQHLFDDPKQNIATLSLILESLENHHKMIYQNKIIKKLFDKTYRSLNIDSKIIKALSIIWNKSEQEYADVVRRVFHDKDMTTLIYLAKLDEINFNAKKYEFLALSAITKQTPQQILSEIDKKDEETQFEFVKAYMDAIFEEYRIKKPHGSDSLGKFLKRSAKRGSFLRKKTVHNINNPVFVGGDDDTEDDDDYDPDEYEESDAPDDDDISYEEDREDEEAVSKNIHMLRTTDGLLVEGPSLSIYVAEDGFASGTSFKQMDSNITDQYVMNGGSFIYANRYMRYFTQKLYSEYIDWGTNALVAFGLGLGALGLGMKGLSIPGIWARGQVTKARDILEDIGDKVAKQQVTYDDMQGLLKELNVQMNLAKEATTGLDKEILDMSLTQMYQKLYNIAKVGDLDQRLFIAKRMTQNIINHWSLGPQPEIIQRYTDTHKWLLSRLDSSRSARELDNDVTYILDIFSYTTKTGLDNVSEERQKLLLDSFGKYGDILTKVFHKVSKISGDMDTKIKEGMQSLVEQKESLLNMEKPMTNIEMLIDDMDPMSITQAYTNSFVGRKGTLSFIARSGINHVFEAARPGARMLDDYMRTPAFKEATLGLGNVNALLMTNWSSNLILTGSLLALNHVWLQFYWKALEKMFSYPHEHFTARYKIFLSKITVSVGIRSEPDTESVYQAFVAIAKADPTYANIDMLSSLRVHRSLERVSRFTKTSFSRLHKDGSLIGTGLLIAGVGLHISEFVSSAMEYVNPLLTKYLGKAIVFSYGIIPRDQIIAYLIKEYGLVKISLFLVPQIVRTFAYGVRQVTGVNLETQIKNSALQIYNRTFPKRKRKKNDKPGIPKRMFWKTTNFALKYMQWWIMIFVIFKHFNFFLGSRHMWTGKNLNYERRKMITY